jgi:hypothetical protein
MDKIYKLLRDNRQTGPYTLEELVQTGLKPYDLIWADGKTAGWMYPSEIDVVKPYLAEKRSEPVKAAEPVLPAPTATPVPEAPTAPAAIATKVVTVPSSARHIFISLPAGTTGNKTAPVQNTPVQNAAIPQAVEEEETPEQKLERKALELRQRVQAAAEAKKAEAGEPTLDTKYARSLDDIKEEYTHWMHEQKSKAPNKGYRFTLSKEQWMRAAMVLVVAGGSYGVFQWLSAPKTKALAVLPQQTAAPVPAANSIPPVETGVPAQSVINTDYTDRNADLLIDLEQSNRQIEKDLERYERKETKAAPPVADGPAEADIPDTYEDYGEEAAPVTYEPQKRESSSSGSPVRTVSYRTEKKAVPLGQQVDVSAKYLRTPRGKGLGGVELRLQNNSAQLLKTVAIDVFYYKEDDRLLGKETVYFTDIRPGENLSVTAPGNKRASSATYQLGLISADGGLYVAKQ